MNLSQLAGLGKVAGIGGIALGVVVLVIRPLIEHATALPEVLRGWLFLAIAIGAFALGALGIVAWIFAGMQIARTEGQNSAATTKDKTKGGGLQYASTKGKNSPATTERG